MNIAIVKSAFDFLCHRNPTELTQVQYVCLLMDFQDTHGDTAIISLAGFYLYAINNLKGEEGTRALRSTFAHDLNGANDKVMQPRSLSYRPFYLHEFFPEALIEDEKETLKAFGIV